LNLFGVRIAEQVLASVNQPPVASDQSWQLAENAPRMRSRSGWEF